ncbi:MAG: hypothetical protein EBQ99_06035 [Planctomycetes bacterium]|nr:hypothetical protein [Planctomycetota bacterium]
MSNSNNTSKNGNSYNGKRGKRRGIEILIVVVILGVLAALVIPGVTGALSDANSNAAAARASQITTMVTRLNSFKPGGASITLSDGTVYSASDLGALVTANYCTADDLTNQAKEDGGWVWNDATKKFTPES